MACLYSYSNCSRGILGGFIIPQRLVSFAGPLAGLAISVLNSFPSGLVKRSSPEPCKLFLSSFFFTSSLLSYVMTSVGKTVPVYQSIKMDWKLVNAVWGGLRFCCSCCCCLLCLCNSTKAFLYSLLADQCQYHLDQKTDGRQSVGFFIFQSSVSALLSFSFRFLERINSLFIWSQSPSCMFPATCFVSSLVSVCFLARSCLECITKILGCVSTC